MSQYEQMLSNFASFFVLFLVVFVVMFVKMSTNANQNVWFFFPSPLKNYQLIELNVQISFFIQKNFIQNNIVWLFPCMKWDPSIIVLLWKIFFSLILLNLNGKIQRLENEFTLCIWFNKNIKKSKWSELRATAPN